MGLFSRMLMIFKMKANTALDQAEDPRQVLDYAYQQQHELLIKTKRGLVEIAASKVQLQQQADKLRSRVPQMEAQAKKAIDAGREDLARMALQRKQTALSELGDLDVRVGDVDTDLQKFTVVEQQLTARIEEFRTRRETMAARYTAAEAQVKVTEALTGISGEFAELGMALGRAEEKTERLQARASAIGELVDTEVLALPGSGTDAVDRELRQISAGQAIEDELAALKGEVVGESPAALPGASDKGEENDDSEQQ